MSDNNKQKTIAIFMAIIFVASIFVGAAGYFTSTNNNSRQANNSQSNSTDQSAKISSYKQRLADNPEDVQALIGLGHVYYDQKNYEQSIKYYERSLKFRPENLGVLVDLGTAYYYKADSNPQRAIELYNRALEINPDFKNALFNKGIVFQYGLRNYQKAVKVWQTFLSKYPNGQMADKTKQLLAEAKNQVNNSEQTNFQQDNKQLNDQSPGGTQSKITNYKERLGENPQDVQAMIGLGDAYYDQQKYQKAINYYEASLKFNPDNLGVLVDLGTAYYYKADSNPKQAIELYNRALEINSTFRNALFNKGVVLQQGLQNYQKAIGVWEEFLAEYPNGKMAQKAKQLLTEAKNSTN